MHDGFIHALDHSDDGGSSNACHKSLARGIRTCELGFRSPISSLDP